ncbi:uncharacterized protein LOC134337760 isoform X1 [Mobula hypostoma]|uniref:uncharacterized protein LOC134337760 isoform X1 n=1 Tax=Mobula hypostoma TaxID=723540 RepID=UPI002FC35D86
MATRGEVQRFRQRVASDLPGCPAFPVLPQGKEVHCVYRPQAPHLRTGQGIGPMVGSAAEAPVRYFRTHHRRPLHRREEQCHRRHTVSPLPPLSRQIVLRNRLRSTGRSTTVGHQDPGLPHRHFGAPVGGRLHQPNSGSTPVRHVYRQTPTRGTSSIEAPGVRHAAQPGPPIHQAGSRQIHLARFARTGRTLGQDLRTLPDHQIPAACEGSPPAVPADAQEVPTHPRGHRWPPARYIFTMVDRFTRWPEAVPLADTSTESCARTLIANWIARFGLPTDITADIKPGLWTALVQLLGTQLHHTTVYHPQSNGLVE